MAVLYRLKDPLPYMAQYPDAHILTSSDHLVRPQAWPAADHWLPADPERSHAAELLSICLLPCGFGHACGGLEPSSGLLVHKSLTMLCMLHCAAAISTGCQLQVYASSQALPHCCNVDLSLVTGCHCD